MRVFSQIEDVQSLHLSDVAVTIGAFDGVHLGHQHLLSELKKQANGRPTVVLTFDPHPERVLSSRPPLQMFGKQDQIDILDKLGIDHVFFIPFNRELAQVSAHDFAHKYIFDLFKPSKIVIGYDFVFGKERKGDVHLLQKIGLSQPQPVDVVQVKPFLDQQEIVSSSLIRQRILEGKIERAEHLLGRPFYILGHVKEGRKLGRQLGFPTANIALFGEITPGMGVYFVSVVLGTETFYGVCNVGTNPTVTGTLDMKIECHILDFARDIYGQSLKMYFHKKLRDEMRFPNLEALKLQIQSDVAQARTLVQLKS